MGRIAVAGGDEMVVAKKVLVVDGNRIVRDWVRGALEPAFEVVELDNPATASLCLIRERPDLVLLDEALALTDLRRFVELARVSVTEKSIRVIIFSTLPPEQLQEKCAACGADGYLRKSGDAASFVARITAHLTREEAADARPAARSSSVPGRRTVIIGGDEAWSRVAVSWLSGRFRIVTAATAAAIREGIPNEKPALLLLGQDLPDAGLEELCRGIRADAELRQTSLLFIAPPEDRARAERVERAGANLALLRPLDEATFFAAVDRLGQVAVRRASRLLLRMEVGLTTGDSFHVGFTSNVSSTGILVESDFQVPVDTEIGVRFFLPGRSAEIITQARVVRVQEPNAGKITFGAQFVEIAPSDRAAIETFVSGRH